MKKQISSALRLLNKAEDWFLVFLLTVMVVVAVIQIFYRNIFDEGIYWADPLLRTLVLWVALAGAVIASRTDNHIRIDFFTRYVAPKFLSYVNRLAYAFSISVCSLISWHAFRFVIDEYEYGSTVFLNVPTWLTASIIPLGFALMAFRYLLLFISPPVLETKNEAEL